MTTIREVSKYAKVSVATISRVVNGNKWVADATREKVLKAMEELGYQPNSLAQSLATNRSNTIGMVVGDLAGPFFGDMMRHAEHAIRKHGKHLIITSGSDSAQSEQEAVSFLLKRRVDALILHLDVMSDEDILRFVDKHDTPIVLVNRFIPEIAEQCIALDNEQGGFLATQHLIEKGHQAIACITGPLYKADARARLNGYRRALEQAQINYDESLVVESDYFEIGGRMALERLRKRNTSFTALFACNDQMAVGAFTALKEAGLSIPNDCAVVGYDDMVMARYVEPALTTIVTPVADFGHHAAMLALNLAYAGTAPVQHDFQADLVERLSS